MNGVIPYTVVHTTTVQYLCKHLRHTSDYTETNTNKHEQQFFTDIRNDVNMMTISLLTEKLSYTTTRTSLSSPVPTFLCQVMYSSLSMARRKLGSLYCGWTKHRADDTIAAVSGPVTPVAVKNSAIFGVRRNGTGRLASSSPVNQRHLVRK